MRGLEDARRGDDQEEADSMARTVLTHHQVPTD